MDKVGDRFTNRQKQEVTAPHLLIYFLDGDSYVPYRT